MTVTESEGTRSRCAAERSCSGRTLGTLSSHPSRSGEEISVKRNRENVKNNNHEDVEISGMQKMCVCVAVNISP